MHLAFAHKIFECNLSPGDFVVDATAGNGHDSLKLATCVLTEASGQLHFFDIQEISIQNTWKRLKRELPKALLPRITSYLACHSHFPFQANSVQLIAYNLGYLPGGEKSLTTRLETTIQSLEQGWTKLKEGGVLVVTCYPGHEAGTRESAAVIQFVNTIQKARVNEHRFREESHAPFVLMIKKLKQK